MLHKPAWPLPAALLAMLANTSTASTNAAPQAKDRFLSDRAMQCVQAAATHHRVNVDVLRAIARHESRGRENAARENTNGTTDVGLMQTNSVHFEDLRRKGVYPNDLNDACISLYVGAWMLSKHIARHGNTWRAVGAYHSSTPACNHRYQILIFNELTDMGVMQGSKLPVPQSCGG